MAPPFGVATDVSRGRSSGVLRIACRENQNQIRANGVDRSITGDLERASEIKFGRLIAQRSRRGASSPAAAEQPGCWSGANAPSLQSPIAKFKRRIFRQV